MSDNYQKAYDKKCEELGIKKMKFKENPKPFSAIHDLSQEKPKTVIKGEEKVLIKKSLLKELLEKLENTYDLTEVNTLKELKEAI